MTDPIRVLSLYEGFFAGGARILHTDVVAGLHAGGTQTHRVLSLASEARRESSVQPMEQDPRYLRLVAAGVDVVALGRVAGASPADPSSFSDAELHLAADAVARADVVLSLKEQPLGLLLALHDRGLMPDIPVAACLHRSDPTHAGPALSWLAEAATRGLVTAKIACAESTSDAYARIGGRGIERHVIPNGIDTARFRPGSRTEILRTRAALSIERGAPVVVFAARFDAMKNPSLFLRAVAVHARANPGAHYLLCGAGMTWGNDGLRALVDESGIPAETRIHALGIRDDMPSLYRIADIVALTSAFGEASPLCLIEGAACGATPVTTDVGDSAREVDGIGIVTPHDPASIAAAWQQVIGSRAVLRDAALAARPRLGRDRMLRDYAAVVESLRRQERAAA